MKLKDLDYTYPEKLVGTEPKYPPRVMMVDRQLRQYNEISFAALIDQIPNNAVLVINNTQVLRRRIFAADLEILFLKKINQTEWEVLFPSKKFAIGSVIDLPGSVQMKLKLKGRPQVVELNCDIYEEYFQKYGELPLPPYIQKAREERHTRDVDDSWYQTRWAKVAGSFAAPTASLHFQSQDLEKLKQKGVQIVELTLHVGLGTFLPVQVDDLSNHIMHGEMIEIPAQTWRIIQQAKANGYPIWALGTTVTRALESAALGMLKIESNGHLVGESQLLIQPGFQFQVINVLMTNFHQPQSTLLALVAAFSDLDLVKESYQWAMQKQFRLFSYGDFSIWK